jgi:hypothetical protein
MGDAVRGVAELRPHPISGVFQKHKTAPAVNVMCLQQLPTVVCDATAECESASLNEAFSRSNSLLVSSNMFKRASAVIFGNGSPPRAAGGKQPPTRAAGGKDSPPMAGGGKDSPPVAGHSFGGVGGVLLLAAIILLIFNLAARLTAIACLLAVMPCPFHFFYT